MTLHLHFLLKITIDLFGSLTVTLSAQPSFQNVYEFGLRIPFAENKRKLLSPVSSVYCIY